MPVSFSKENRHNPAMLRRPPKDHKAAIAMSIIGILVMIFPLIVDMGHPVPIISTEIIGFLALLVGAAVFADTEIRDRKITKALTGNKYKAVIVNVNHTVKSIRRSRNYDKIDFYNADCEMTDTDTGETRMVSSLYVAYYLNGLEGRLVDVYIDPDDKNNYYVDLTTLAQEE